MSANGAVVVRPAPGALAPGHHHHHHHHHPHEHHHHHHHYDHAPRKLQTESLTFCGNCEKPGDGDARLLRCQGCHNAVYCNAECQKAQWPIHKIDCKRLRAIYASMPPDVAERQKRLNAWMRQRIALFKRAGYAAVLFPSTSEPAPSAEESTDAVITTDPNSPSDATTLRPVTIDTHFLAVTVTPFTSTTGSTSFEVADADVGDWNSVPELWVTANVSEQQAQLLLGSTRKAAEEAEKDGSEPRTIRGVLWVLVICDMVPHLHPIIIWEDEAEKEKARKEAEGEQEADDWEKSLKDGCKLGSGQPKSPVADAADSAA
ncbi:hypothetical protein FRB90_001395 [Tulasnella sp. 427]|nr:hypothetical protein FRB90_001395 [Tulasnella sp. 427]